MILPTRNIGSDTHVILVFWYLQFLHYQCEFCGIYLVTSIKVHEVLPLNVELRKFFLSLDF